MEKRELTIGVYEATPAFRAIESHSCVCYKDNMELVAVVGPAEDKESQEFADLFAAAPELLEALQTIADEFEHIWLYCDDGWGDSRHGSMIEAAREAIAKAKGANA